MNTTERDKTLHATLERRAACVATKNFRSNNCLRCHGVDEGSVVGAASVTIDVKDGLALISRLNTWIWIWQAILQILCAVTLYFVAGSVVRKIGGEPEIAANVARTVAQGDLTVRFDVRDGDTTSVIARMKEMQGSLVRTVSEVRKGAEGGATASAQIAQGNVDLSSRTEEQAGALQQAAVSMEELNNTVSPNPENAQHAKELALSVSSVAVKGGEVIGQVVETMRGINESSHKIADIIGVIDGIAFQTNILALNAAVEAASVEQVTHGSVLVDEAGARMTEIVASIQRVTEIMAEISSASAEQSSGVSHVSEAVRQMDDVTQQNAALVEQCAAAAQSLNEKAQHLVDAVAVFKLSAG